MHYTLSDFLSRILAARWWWQQHANIPNYKITHLKRKFPTKMLMVRGPLTRFHLPWNLIWRTPGTSPTALAISTCTNFPTWEQQGLTSDLATHNLHKLPAPFSHIFHGQWCRWGTQHSFYEGDERQVRNKQDQLSQKTNVYQNSSSHLGTLWQFGPRQTHELHKSFWIAQTKFVYESRGNWWGLGNGVRTTAPLIHLPCLCMRHLMCATQIPRAATIRSHLGLLSIL